MNKEVNSKNKKGFAMSDIKKFVLNNKKGILVSVVGLLIVGLVIVGSVALYGNKSTTNKEEKLEKRLKELAKDFYEVKYYPNLTNSKTGEAMNDKEKKEFAQKFKETGITIDLNSLARVYGEKKEEILAEFKNGDNTCNYDNTKVIITPEEPFEVSSYKIEVILDCGFEERK